jgi:hypothetical protein
LVSCPDPRAIAAWEFAVERIARDEGASSDVECIESVMSESSRVHERLLARSPGPRPPSAGDVTTPRREESERNGRALARQVRVKERPGAEGEKADGARGRRGAGVRGGERDRGVGLGERVVRREALIRPVARPVLAADGEQVGSASSSA